MNNNTLSSANGTLRRQDTSDPRAPSGVRFVQDTPAVKLNSNQFGKDDPTSNGYATSSTLSASASDNSASLLTIPFPWISLGCLLGPLFAFGYCIVYSFFYHYEWTTQTHCNVWNFAPSISASIGLFRPQKYVWKLFVSLHSAPRYSGKLAYSFLIMQNILLHFVAFFHVASLFSTGVDNKKALELDNRIFFSNFSLISM